MDEANFSGDRLRLTTFLRVVENVPLRPSRFRRRVEHVEQRTDESHQLLPVVDSTINLKASEPIPDDDASLTIAPADVYVIPRSPVLETPLLTPSDIDGINLNGSDLIAAPSPRNEQAGIKVTRPDRERTAVMRAPLEMSTSPAVSSGSRKRRLNVNALALLRTSTLDGLPEPSV